VSDDWDIVDQADYWANRRPYIVRNGQVWIGQPGTHHDTAPPHMTGPDASLGEIHNDEVRPYKSTDATHVTLVQEAWHKQPDRPQAQT
jgi:hypothetical protein